MKNKKVSIVLPVYNGSRYLREAIESILAQTYSNIELIIVNDCSTDNTEAIVREYMAADNRIILINNVVNLKLPRSLNIGFSYAKGEYFTWTSDDNRYHNNAIEVMLDFLEKNHGIGMVYADYYLIDSHGNFVKENTLLSSRNLIFSNCIGACFMYRKCVADYVGEYDAALFLAEDYDYWVRISINFEIYHLETFLYDYRIHDGSLSHQKRDLIQVQTSRVLLKNFFYLYVRCGDLSKRFRFLDTIVGLRMNDNEVLAEVSKVNFAYSFYHKLKYFWRWLKKML
ncbi:MAG: glycosyltransferase [Anaerovibrio sp.]